MIHSSIRGKPPFAFPWMWFRFSHLKWSTFPSDSNVRSSFPLCYYCSASSETRNSVSDYLISRHQFSIAAASKVSCRVSGLDNYEKFDSILSWLKDVGFSQNQLESAISRTPQLLFADLDKTLKPKHQIFKDLGFQADDIVEIIVVDPWLLHNRAANSISASIAALKSVFESVEDISRLLKKCTWFLKADLDSILLVNLEFLQKDCGVHPSQIRRFLFNFPRLFLNQPEYIRGIVRRIDEMQFGDRNSGMFLHAVRSMSSMTPDHWEAKLQLFRSLGMTEENILHIFRKCPQVFATSERKIRELIDLLIGSEKSDIDLSLIVRHPGLLLFSAEKRIKPRIHVMDLLEANNLIPKRPDLPVLCKLSNHDFELKYVLPYSNIVCKTYMLDKLK